MNRSSVIAIILSAASLALTAATALTASFPGGDYDLTWHSIDGGGGTSSGGGFTLSGTIGQPDAGAMSGGTYSLAGGFWAGADAGPITPACVGDLNNSGAVDVQDLLILLSAWGPCGKGPCPADLNNSGTVDVQDLLILLGNWGSCPE